MRPSRTPGTPGSEQAPRRLNFQQVEERPADDDAPPPYEDVVGSACKDLTIEELRQGMVNCNQCNGRHVIYECPQLSNMNAEQQRSHFRQMSENRRAQRSTAVRQLSTHNEYKYEDQDPVYDTLDYDDDMTEQD